MTDLAALSEGVVTGDAEKVEELTREALDGGMAPIEVLNDGLVKGMDVIGEKFKNYEVYLPGLIVSSRAMKAGRRGLRMFSGRASMSPRLLWCSST